MPRLPAALVVVALAAGPAALAQAAAETDYSSGSKVGTMRVSSAGRAHREWSTDRGQAVPGATARSTVKVRTGGGTLIASGRYRLDTGD